MVLERAGALLDFGLRNLWKRPINILLIIIELINVVIVESSSKEVGAALFDGVLALLLEVLNPRNVTKLASPATILVILDVCVGVDHRNQDIVLRFRVDEVVPGLVDDQWLCSDPG